MGEGDVRARPVDARVISDISAPQRSHVEVRSMYTQSLAPGTRSVAILLSIVVAACSGGPAQPTPTNAPPAQTTQPPAATLAPAATAPAVTFEKDVKVADDGRTVHVTCWGDGGPAILLEGGHPGPQLSGWNGARAFISALAAERRICAYDRAGWGSSDPAPSEPRDLDDVTNDLHAVVHGVGVDLPVVLVGGSFGGMIVAYYPHRYPDDVLGVVLLDVPSPAADLKPEDAPELAWDADENPEHVEVVAEFENRLAKEQFPFEAPLLVVTGSGGQSSAEDQAFWLAWSETHRQIELPGGHDIASGSPTEIAAAVLALPDFED